MIFTQIKNRTNSPRRNFSTCGVKFQIPFTKGILPIWKCISTTLVANITRHSPSLIIDNLINKFTGLTHFRTDNISTLNLRGRATTIKVLSLCRSMPSLTCSREKCVIGVTCMIISRIPSSPRLSLCRINTINAFIAQILTRRI